MKVEIELAGDIDSKTALGFLEDLAIFLRHFSPEIKEVRFSR